MSLKMYVILYKFVRLLIIILLDVLLLLPQANGRACVDFGCFCPINGLF
jgi:hypothetical protein